MELSTEEKVFTGLLEDNRSAAEKEYDVAGIEFGTTLLGPVNWRQKKTSELNLDPLWWQDGSGSCVAFSTARMIAKEIKRRTGRWLDLSPGYIYQKRVNKPADGMITYDAVEIANNDGVTLDALTPSFAMTEAQINAVKYTAIDEKIAQAFASLIGKAIIAPKDFEAVAAILEQKKAVIVSIYGTTAEWKLEVPKVIDPKLERWTAPIRHKVTFVDYMIHPTHGKVLVVEDSANFQGKKTGMVRYMTEAFFKARASDMYYFEDFDWEPDFDGNLPLPAGFTFTKNLKFIPLNTDGKIADMAAHEAQKADVIQLQKFLAMPPQLQTGYYGRMTAEEVLRWQIAAEISPEEDLINLGGKYFGPKSREVANQR